VKISLANKSLDVLSEIRKSKLCMTQKPEKMCLSLTLTLSISCRSLVGDPHPIQVRIKQLHPNKDHVADPEHFPFSSVASFYPLIPKKTNLRFNQRRKILLGLVPT
jgi:hypothetical protein